MDKDLQLWERWKKDPNPENVSALLKSLKPVIYQATAINQGSLAPAVVEAEAKIQAVKAFHSFNPKKNVKLSTHVTNQMKKVNRINYKYQEVFKVPEQRRIKFGNFQAIKENLAEKYGRPASTAELSRSLGWSKSEVGRFNKESFSELSESSPYSSDITAYDQKQDTMLGYVYNDLNPRNQSIFEHTTGYNDQPILTNAQMQKKFNLSQGQISYAKETIRDKIKNELGGFN